MQYLSWPDHGTPSDSVEFVEFVESVRDFREKSATVAPTIVHCRSEAGPGFSVFKIKTLDYYVLYKPLLLMGPLMCDAKFLKFHSLAKTFIDAKVLSINITLRTSGWHRMLFY